MGSGQSSPVEESGAFSIDPNGNISSMKKRVDIESIQSNRPSESSNTNNTQANPRPKPSQISDDHETQQHQQQQRQLATLNNMPIKQNELTLREADEIVTRMKMKYKPNSAELAGKNRSPFEDIERDLTQCYKINKDQPIKCVELTKSYNKIVEEHRSQLLKGQSNAPPVK